MLNVGILGTNKVAVINRTVPDSVSRLNPATHSAHLSLTIDASGNIKAQNLKDANCTYVNGLEISSKTVQPGAALELGKNRFQITVQEILNVAKQLIPGAVPNPPVPSGPNPEPKPDKPTYNVHHLRRIWNDYKAACKQIQIERIIAQRKQRLPFILSAIIGIPLSILASKTQIECLPWIGGLITAGFMAYFMFRDPSIELTEKKEQLDKDLEHMYLCPNPDCNKMLPMKDIDFILRQYEHKCPYCKCSYVDKH